jgi:hypothetical protein
MGHAAGNSDMSAVYRQTVDDGRLQSVVDHVYRWLYDGAQDGIEVDAAFRVVG